MTYTFSVEGPLRGYRRPNDRGGARRVDGSRGVGYRDYALFKRAVLLLAMEQGFRRTKTTRKAPAHLSVFVNWEAAARSDWSNVFKAVEDALFEQDRYVVPGAQNGAKWDTGSREAAFVVIEDTK